MTTQLHTSISKLFLQLETVVSALSDEQFTLAIPLLGGSSIGQHLRHILECYIELGNGYQDGTVNYDARKRDLILQTCKSAAISKLREMDRLIKLANKTLFLSCEQSSDQPLNTNYNRELLYNLEHTVHHMALIRVALSLISTLQIPEDFGVAASTIKYRMTCAQ